MHDYYFKGISLDKILESGSSSSLDGYNINDYRYTTNNNSKPKPTNYLESGVDIANKASAKVDQYTSWNHTSGTTIAKPNGATGLRWVIVGGSGGGGGGGGGGNHLDGGSQDHAIRGYDGNDGYQGHIIYGYEGNISNVNSVKFDWGNGGAGGGGGAARIVNTGSVATVEGGDDGSYGGTTKMTLLNSSGNPVSIYNAPGGAGGKGGPYRQIEENRGWGSSFKGSDSSSADTLSSDNGSASGNNTYGSTDNDAGNTFLTASTPVHSANLKSNYENSYFINQDLPLTRGGEGGKGGWGYNSNNSKGANAGNDGISGNNGGGSLMWLY